jgi:hypothetical protein
MARYNGEGPNYCKNCGAEEGIHRADDMACPDRGREQTGLDPHIYGPTVFDPQEWVDEMIVLKTESLKGRTLFDDYFLALLSGVSVVMAHSHDQVVDDIQALPNQIINLSFDMAVAAVNIRNEYMKSTYDKAVKK